jgi:hypothetical protein
MDEYDGLAERFEADDPERVRQLDPGPEKPRRADVRLEPIGKPKGLVSSARC